MRQQTLIARKFVAIIGLAALLPPAPLHAAGATLTEPGAPGATHLLPEPVREAATITTETRRITLVEADTLRPATLDLRTNRTSETPAVPSANEIVRSIPSSAYENLPDAQWLSIAKPAVTTAPSWLGLSDSRLVPGKGLRIITEPPVSQSAVQPSRGSDGTAAIAVAAVVAGMVAMVAVAVAVAAMQAEVLTD